MGLGRWWATGLTPTAAPDHRPWQRIQAGGAGRWPSLAGVGVESLEGAVCPQTPHLMSSPLPHGGAGGARAVEQAL